jgi:hypothetical protein
LWAAFFDVLHPQLDGRPPHQASKSRASFSTQTSIPHFPTIIDSS